ncbi:uncharacterized protein [Ambystoma mexicanum]|uniref:uncharacterized protein isoform X2 n=1 Tax=Ambystoma mexicanum TaxID=8296 RepID=UPI0037E842D6
MALLYLCLLFSAAFGPSSAEEECNGITAVNAPPGGSALLQITDLDRAFCRGRCLFKWRSRGSRIVAVEWNPSSITTCSHTPDCRVLPGGSLELSHITPEEAGDYTALMWAEDEALRPEEWITKHKCFLLQLQGPSSAEEECNGTTAVYAAPGGSALLQITDSDQAFCPWGCHFRWTRSDSRLVAAAWDPRGIIQCGHTPNCRVLPGGSLELSHITPEEARDYTLHMWAEDEALRPEEWITKHKCFLLQFQDPVSTPEVNYTCHLNGGVQLSCLMGNGTDPSYSWSVNGTPSWLPSRVVEMSYESVLRNVTCTVKNHVSEEQSQSTDVTCPVSHLMHGTQHNLAALSAFLNESVCKRLLYI